MFFNYNDIQITNLTGTPVSSIFNDYSVPPYAINGPKSGAYTIIQYIRMLQYIKNGYLTDFTQTNIDTLYNKAKSLDQNLTIDIDEDYPTLYSTMNAACELKLTNGTSVRWGNTIASLKLDMMKYGCVLVELAMAETLVTSKIGRKLTPDSTTKTIYDDYTKGMIAFNYDQTYLYLQNTLGCSWGSLGSCRIKWTDFEKQLETPDNNKIRYFIKYGCIVNGTN